jgi:DNA-binding transcriptional LysR family regulator
MAPTPRNDHNMLTPDALVMMDTIARTGSFAAAARELGKVPSALTYSVRQLEDALDVLLFDRRSGQAQLTSAGHELLNEGRRLLQQIEAVANRVRRVGSGWESQLTIAMDDALPRATVFELCDAFYALRPWAAASSRPDKATPARARDKAGAAHGMPAHDAADGPGTRIRLRAEVLAGTWESLLAGEADLAIGVSLGGTVPPDIATELLGEVPFVLAMAPHHPLAAATHAITDAELLKHRAIAVADSAQRLNRVTVNLLPGQDVLTVANMQDKLDAQLRCLGCGFVPESLARPYVQAGRLVVREVAREATVARFGYAWRCVLGPKGQRLELGKALQWWLQQLAHPKTRLALLDPAATY